MRKEPTQKFLKEAYDNGGLFRDSRRIYQAEYSQAQKSYWYFPISYASEQKIKGFEIIKELGE